MRGVWSSSLLEDTDGRAQRYLGICFQFKMGDCQEDLVP